MSEIKKINNFKELLLELLQNTVNIISKPKTNQILSNRTKTFIQEYHKLNNISISTTCSVKTDREYKTGKLILNNNKLVILQYQSNKKNQNYNLNTIIQTVDTLNPIFFIDFNMATSELVILPAAQHPFHALGHFLRQQKRAILKIHPLKQRRDLLHRCSP